MMFVEHYRSLRNTFISVLKNLAVICMIIIFVASPYLFEVSELITWILLIPVCVFFIDYCVRNL